MSPDVWLRRRNLGSGCLFARHGRIGGASCSVMAGAGGVVAIACTIHCWSAQHRPLAKSSLPHVSVSVAKQRYSWRAQACTFLPAGTCTLTTTAFPRSRSAPASAAACGMAPALPPSSSVLCGATCQLGSSIEHLSIWEGDCLTCRCTDHSSPCCRSSSRSTGPTSGPATSMTSPSVTTLRWAATRPGSDTCRRVRHLLHSCT